MRVFHLVATKTNEILGNVNIINAQNPNINNKFRLITVCLILGCYVYRELNHAMIVRLKPGWKFIQINFDRNRWTLFNWPKKEDSIIKKKFSDMNYRWRPIFSYRYYWKYLFQSVNIQEKKMQKNISTRVTALIASTC